MKVVISRHQGFVDFCISEGLCPSEVQVIPHASEEGLKDKEVLTSGLPLHLAALCKSVTTVPLNLPPELRGVELTEAQVREHASPPTTFVVKVVE